MIKCPTCRTDNLDTSQYCDECGTPLAGVRQNAGNNDHSPPPYVPPAPPNFVSASVTSVGIPAMVEEQNLEAPPESVSLSGDHKPKGVHASLTIERGSAAGAEFFVSSDEANIGRWDADNGVFPDVDLDAHDPEAKVSRRHARILRDGGRYFIEDLGSTNGTFVNRGRRLIPGNRQPLEDGDEIIVGKTFLRFRVIQ
jgi:pSer/pThr/pTyr-binding forkhead associated (FHA) protein